MAYVSPLSTPCWPVKLGCHGNVLYVTYEHCTRVPPLICNNRWEQCMNQLHLHKLHNKWYGTEFQLSFVQVRPHFQSLHSKWISCWVPHLTYTSCNILHPKFHICTSCNICPLSTTQLDFLSDLLYIIMGCIKYLCPFSYMPEKIGCHCNLLYIYNTQIMLPEFHLHLHKLQCIWYKFRSNPHKLPKTPLSGL